LSVTQAAFCGYLAFTAPAQAGIGLPLL